jgi:hypothetical protein
MVSGQKAVLRHGRLAGERREDKRRRTGLTGFTGLEEWDKDRCL